MKKLILGVFALMLFSCTQQESKKASTPNYFDISGYFTEEVNRLQNSNPTIVKSVIAMGKTESHSTKIADWKTELASFNNADINKASWQGEFTETIAGENISYVTSNPKIPIKKMEIKKVDHKVKGIMIVKSNENILYNSSDTLFYYPDSIYAIHNNQKIRLLARKTYQVTGRFK